MNAAETQSLLQGEDARVGSVQRLPVDVKKTLDPFCVQLLMRQASLGVQSDRVCRWVELQWLPGEEWKSAVAAQGARGQIRGSPGAADPFLVRRARSYEHIGGQIRAHFFKSVHKSAKCAFGRKNAHFF